MSNFSAFMKKNKVVKPNTTFPATKSLCDETGKPLLWEIKALSTKESEEIREACTKEVPIPGKKGMYRQKTTPDYTVKLMVAAIVSPNLYDAELQNSYGVLNPEDLLKEMIDSPAEFANLLSFIQEYSGFDLSFDDEVNEAKN